MEEGNNNSQSQRRRNGAGRTLILAFLAMVVGYYLAGNINRIWRDTSGVKHDFEVMRTYARITIPEGEGFDLSPAELAREAEKAVRRVNDLMSPRGEASDIARLNSLAANEWREVDPLTWTVVMEALRWNRLTDGAFDPTIGPVKRLFRFDREETEKWPGEGELRQAKSRVGADKILFNREGMRLAFSQSGMTLDLGAIAKCFAVDQAAEVLIAHGVKNAVVDIGGELRVIGQKPGNPPAPWRTGIRNPRGDEPLEELPLADAAVATSGDYENYFIYKGKRYEHIIDPRTGLPLAEGTASVTVVHPASCLAADALATSLCVLGPKAGGEFIRAQALGLFSSGLRVIMLTVGEGGKLIRTEYVVDKAGGVSENVSEVTP